jgi:hypothetical protein
VPATRHQRWLEGELPRLVEAGVLDDAAAARLRAHYRSGAPARAAVPLFAVLGASLVGLGIILLLAHNWESLSRAERAALSIALLLLAQGLAGFALLRRTASVAWSEGSALFLVIASGATIALLGQTYQVPGNLRSFLGQWLVLALAVPYLFAARGAAALYLFGATVWLIASLADDASIRAWWLWLAGVAPLLALLSRRAAGTRDQFLGWVAVPCVTAGLVMAFRVEPWTGLAMLAASVQAACYALGALTREREGEPFFALPARTLGGIGIAGGAVQLGKTFAWKGWLSDPRLTLHHVTWLDTAGAWAVGAVCAALAAVGVLRLAPRSWPRALLAAFPLAVGAGLAALRATHSVWIAVVLMNAYALVAGIGMTLLGMRESRTGLANAGLLFLAWLVFDRFTDFELSYTLRGVSFIALGVCFLALNLRLRRRRAPEGAAA